MENVMLIGCQPFDLVIREKAGELSIKGSAQYKGHSRLEFWSTAQKLDVDSALGKLISAWPLIAGPFYEGGADEAVVDISALVGEQAEPAMFNRVMQFASVVRGDEIIHLGSDTVIAVEVFLRYGDIMAGRTTDPALKASWLTIRVGTDLCPFPVFVTDSIECVNLEINEEADFYARKLGQDPAIYKRSAYWIHSSHIIVATTSSGFEPYPNDATVIPAGLPDEKSVEDMLAKAAKLMKVTVPELKRDALAIRNVDLRQVMVFSKWYPRTTETSPGPTS